MNDNSVNNTASQSRRSRALKRRKAPKYYGEDQERSVHLKSLKIRRFLQSDVQLIMDSEKYFTSAGMMLPAIDPTTLLTVRLHLVISLMSSKTQPILVSLDGNFIPRNPPCLSPPNQTCS